MNVTLVPRSKKEEELFAYALNFNDLSISGKMLIMDSKIDGCMTSLFIKHKHHMTIPQQ